MGLCASKDDDVDFQVNEIDDIGKEPLHVKNASSEGGGTTSLANKYAVTEETGESNDESRQNNSNVDKHTDPVEEEEEEETDEMRKQREERGKLNGFVFGT